MRSPEPLVSVIIPYHNDFEYLKEALSSVLGSTYTQIEIFIIDDFSKVPLKYEDLAINEKKFPISIIRNSSNRGPGYSRNVGVKKCSGEFVAFLDADDIWLPGITEKQVKVFLDNPETVWVYTDGYYLVDNVRHRRPNSYFQGLKDGQLPSGPDVNEFHLRGNNYMLFSGNMYRKSTLLKTGLFNEDLAVSEDWDFFVRMAEQFRDGVQAISEPLMIYRVNNEGRHFVGRKDYVSVNVKILEGAYQRQGLLPQRLKTFNEAVAMVYERAGIQRLNAGCNDEAKEFLFHAKTACFNLHLRMLSLRILTLLPNIFYKLAVRLYERL